MTPTVSIEFTLEEAMEARFCVKRYSELYPMHPNEHFQNVRQNIIAKIAAAYTQYTDKHEAELDQLYNEAQNYD